MFSRLEVKHLFDVFHEVANGKNIIRSFLWGDFILDIIKRNDSHSRLQGVHLSLNSQWLVLCNVGRSDAGVLNEETKQRGQFPINGSLATHFFGCFFGCQTTFLHKITIINCLNGLTIYNVSTCVMVTNFDNWWPEYRCR